MRLAALLALLTLTRPATANDIQSVARLAPICKDSCPKAAVCYAIDESGSITRSDFDRQANVLVGLTSVFELLAPGSTYAVAGFADQAHIIQAATPDVDKITSALLSNKQKRGGTASGTGLNQCYELIKSYAGPKVIVIVTDGVDNRSPKGTEVDDLIKAQGFRIVSVGVGTGVFVPDLLDIASPDSGRAYFSSVANYRVFSEALGPIIRNICEASALWTPTPAPARCGDVWCAKCGSTLECYANSGSAVVDARACDSITQPGVCSGVRRSRCKQTCIGFGDGAPVTCYKGEMFGKRADGAACKTKGEDGEKLFPTNFARYQACETPKGRYYHKCSKRKCNADDPSCWPQQNL